MDNEIKLFEKVLWYSPILFNNCTISSISIMTFSYTIINNTIKHRKNQESYLNLSK